MMVETNLYKDTITDLNIAWRQLVRYYVSGDTRVGYLRGFELALSQCCPDMMLWNFKEYKILPELPENTRTKVSSGHFLNCLLAYETIMRRVGLIDKDPAPTAPMQSVEILDMGE